MFGLLKQINSKSVIEKKTQMLLVIKIIINRFQQKQSTHKQSESLLKKTDDLIQEKYNIIRISHVLEMRSKQIINLFIQICCTNNT